jgi:hypothetical protein
MKGVQIKMRQFDVGLCGRDAHTPQERYAMTSSCICKCAHAPWPTGHAYNRLLLLMMMMMMPTLSASTNAEPYPSCSKDSRRKKHT